MTRPLALAILLLSSLAGASEPAPPVAPEVAGIDAGTPAPEKLRVAVLELHSNKAAADAAPVVGSLIASHLAESPQVRLISQSDIAAALGVERQRQMLGSCSDEACMAELSGALGTRYVVNGRLDRLGESYVLTATLYDSQRAVAVVKPRADSANEAGLPAAAHKVAEEILSGLGVAAAAAPSDEPENSGITLGVKLGNQFFASLQALNPGAELEFGWRFDPEWIVFIQIGFNLVKATDENSEERQLAIVPSVLGVRHLHRLKHSFQPYWGLGLGLQLAIGQFGPFKDTESFPTVIGMFGFQYMFTARFGALMEASTNIAQTILGLRHEGVGGGLNFDLSIGVLYRF